MNGDAAVMTGTGNGGSRISEYVRAALALVFSITGLCFIGMAVFLPVRDEKIAFVSVGYVSGYVSGILSFYFSSSIGSENKTAALVSAAKDK